MKTLESRGIKALAKYIYKWNCRASIQTPVTEPQMPQTQSYFTSLICVFHWRVIYSWGICWIFCTQSAPYKWCFTGKLCSHESPPLDEKQALLNTLDFRQNQRRMCLLPPLVTFVAFYILSHVLSSWIFFPTSATTSGLAEANFFPEHNPSNL